MPMRYINLNRPQLPDPKVVAWLEANDLDPGEIPAVQYVQVTDQHIIYQAFLRGPDGHKLPIHDSNGEACGWQKQLITAPLLSTPESHGLFQEAK